MTMLCTVCGTRGVLGRTDKCGPCHRVARAQTPGRQRGRPVRDDLTPALEASVTILTRLTQLEAQVMKLLTRVDVLEAKLLPAPPAAVWPPPTEKRTKPFQALREKMSPAAQQRVTEKAEEMTMTPHGPSCMCLACRASR
jgi:hypothetical protein